MSQASAPKNQPTPDPVLKLLKFDHKRIGDLLFHYEQSEEPLHKLSFAETALNELTINLTLEHELLYPYLQNEQRTAHDRVLNASEQARRTCHQLEALIADIGKLSSWSQTYDTKFSTIGQLAQTHFQQQETQIFPHLSNRPTEELYRRLSQRRDELIAEERGEPRDFTPQVLLFSKFQEHSSYS